MECEGLIKAVWIASIGLAALFVLSPCANAQQASTTVSYVPKLQPVIRSYPGILGIRVGMTVPQAEAIAEKSYPGKPHYETKVRDTFRYKGVAVQSHPFVQLVDFQKKDGNDELALTFGGPATGNRLYALDRTMIFNDNVFDAKNGLTDPLVSTLKTSLIKKYGSTSFQSDPQTDMLTFAWVFTPKSHMSCSSYVDCARMTPSQSGPVRDNDLYGIDSQGSEELARGCESLSGHPGVFTVVAAINVNSFDRTKADKLVISIWDASACMNDGRESVNQLKTAAIKIYKAVKAPAAPKL